MGQHHAHYGLRTKASLFVLGGQEGLRVDSIVEFSAGSEDTIWQKCDGPVFHKSTLNQRRSTDKKAMEFKNIYLHISHTDTTGHVIYSTMHMFLFLIA